MPERPSRQKGRRFGRVLDDYVTWRSGGTPSKANQRYWAGNIPWVTPKDMKWFDLKTTTDYLTPDGVAAGSAVAPQKVTYIVVRGMILAHTFPVSQMSTQAAFNQDVKAVDPGPELLPRYLAYWFKAHADDLLRLVGESTHGTKKLDLPDLRVFPMNPPKLAAQGRIVEILTAIDEQIGAVTKSIEKLGLVRQGVITDLVERIDESHHSVLRVADLVVTGQFGSAIGPFGSDLIASDYRASGIPVIFVRDIQSGRFDWKSSVYVSRRKALELNAHRADPADVLITKMGDPPGVATVHPEGFPPAVITADIIRIRPQEQLAVPEWLALYINSSHVTTQIRGLAAGVTRQKLTLAGFRGVTVSLPTIQDQLSTVKRVAAIDRLLSSEEDVLRNLQGTKHGLLVDLLHDCIHVPQAGAS